MEMEILIEKQQILESERQKTMSDPRFLQWCQENRISTNYKNSDSSERALDIMSSWGIKNKNGESIFKSTIDRIICKI